MKQYVKYFKAVLLIFIATSGFAQQESQNTMFWNNYSAFNPAFSGLKSNFQAYSSYKLWRGDFNFFNHDLHQLNAGVDHYLESAYSGIGLNYSFDQAGSTTIHRVMGNYNYQFKLNDDMIFSTGIGLGLQRYTIQRTQLVGPFGSNPCDDPAIPCGSQSTIKPIVNFGVGFKSEGTLLGIGFTQLNEPQFQLYSADRHFFISAEYKINLGHNFHLTPAVLWKGVTVKYSVFDANTRVIHANGLILGTTVRWDASRLDPIAICPLAGYVISDKFTVSYARDIYINGFENFYKSWNEVNVSFTLDD